jgi:pyrroline-5-carboxylate reductase
MVAWAATKDPVEPKQNSQLDLIVFIGGGQMATALIAGLLRSGSSAQHILVVEPDVSQRERLRDTLGVRTLSAADDSLRGAHVIVWAIKPQIFAAAAAQIRRWLAAPLHVSIVAGVPVTTLARVLGSGRVVRVMPNTPALVGAGVTGMFAAAEASRADRDIAQRLLTPTGYTFWVDSDERIDAVTAISGSGPGYVFHFLESFQEAARSLGFSESQARELVVRTAAGALEQARSDETPFATLRDRVTSKRGTTEAGLRVLAERQFSSAVSLAVESAYARAQELSRELSEEAEGSGEDT